MHSPSSLNVVQLSFKSVDRLLSAAVLGYGRDEMLVVFLAKTYCLYLFYYMAARLGACLLPTSIGLTLRGIIASEKINACWRESAKPLLFYCGTMPA